MNLNRNHLAFKSIILQGKTQDNNIVNYNYEGNLSIYQDDHGYKFQIDEGDYTDMKISALQVTSIDNGSQLDYFNEGGNQSVLSVKNILDGGILNVKDMKPKDYPSVNVETIDNNGQVILEASKANVNKIQKGGKLSILNESYAYVNENHGKINLKGIILHGNNTLHLQQNSGTVNVDINTEPNINMYISTATIENNNGEVTCGTKINNVTINSGNKHIYPKLYVKA